MTPEQIGAYIGAIFLGASGVIGANRYRKARNEGRNDPENPLGLGESKAIREAEVRLTRLETRFDDLVRRMEEHDERAARERIEILTAIEGFGQRLEIKVDALTKLVYERRSESRE